MPQKVSNRQMRKHLLTITISSSEGSRTFVINRNLKKRIIVACLIVGVYCVGSTVSTVYLRQEYQQMTVQLPELKKQNVELVLYKQQVEDEKARDKVRFAMDNINQTASAKKAAFLKVIPSGNPLPPLPGPGEDIKFTSEFGTRNHPILKVEKDHQGVDLRAALGTPVYATANGIVVSSEYNSGYGNVVKINHAYGFQTVYAHLNESLVQTGQLVSQGTVIAKSGNTGRSDGPHLHYEVRFRDKPLNSANFIQWNQQQFDYIFTNEKDVRWDFFVKEII